MTVTTDPTQPAGSDSQPSTTKAGNRRRLILLAAIAFVLLWPAPHIEGFRSPNELVRIYSVRAMVDHHVLHIDHEIAEYGPLIDQAQRDGHHYSDKAPGLSLLAAPLYGAMRLVIDRDSLSNRELLWILRLAIVVLPTILWIAVLGAWLAALGFSEGLRSTLQIAYALGTPAIAYAFTFTGHQAAAWMIGISLAAAWFARRHANPGILRAASGFLIGLAAITEYPSLALVPIVAGLTLLGTSPWKRGALAFCAGLALPLAAAAAYHTFAFGAPWRTGYSFITHATFAKVHAVGLMGISLPSAKALFGLTLGTHRGLLPLSSWLACAPLALLAMRSKRQHLLVLALWAHVAVMLWVATGFGYWVGGWSVGPRHLVSTLPSLAVLAGIGMRELVGVAAIFDQRADRRAPQTRRKLRIPGLRLRGGRGMAVNIVMTALVVASVFTCVSAAVTFPGFPTDLQHPWINMSLALLTRLQFSYSLGTLLGLNSSTAMIPVLAVTAGLMLWAAAGAAVTPWLRGCTKSQNVQGSSAPEHRGVLWLRLGGVQWLVIIGLGAWIMFSPLPRAQDVSRVAWVGHTMWEPKDVQHGWDARLARWEQATRAVAAGQAVKRDFDDLAAMQAHLGNNDAALAEYARGEWMTGRASRR